LRFSQLPDHLEVYLIDGPARRSWVRVNQHKGLPLRRSQTPSRMRWARECGSFHLHLAGERGNEINRSKSAEVTP